MTGAESWRRVAPRIALAIVVLACAYLYAGVFRGEPAGDDNTFHLAEITRLAQCLAAGDLDWWNPSANLGYASGYYYQVVPQLMPAALAAATGTSPLFWFQVGIFLPLVLAPVAAYRGMRLLGEGGATALGAAIAIAVCLSGSKWGHASDGTFSVGLYTQTWALAALPLALGAGFRWIDTGRSLGGAVAWGVFVGLCHPFAGVALGVALAAGEVVRTVTRLLAPLIPGSDEPAGATIRAAAARLVVLGVLLVAGSVVAWLPVLVDYDGFGGFPHRVSGEAGPGLITLAKDLARGWILDVRRIPVLTWLAPAALILYPASWRPRLWGAALAFCALLAAGPHLVTADDLFPAVRFFGALQVVLALAIGAGTAGAVALLWERGGELTGLIGVAARAIGVAAPLAAIAMTAIPAAMVIHGRVRVSDDYPDIHREQLDELLAAIRTARPGRQQARKEAEAHWLNLLPYVYADRPALLQMGGAGLQSSPNYVFLWELRETQHAARAARLFDAPLVLVRRRHEAKIPGTVLATTADFQLEELPSPGLVSPVQVTGELPPGRAEARAAALRWLSSEMPMVDQVLAYAGSGIAGPPPQGRVRSAQRHAPGGGPDITAEVEADAPTTFMLRESWHPRWRVTIDGRPAAVRRVTPDVLAVDAPAGQHRLAWEFARPSWVIALWLAWPLAALLGGLGGWLTRRG